MMAEREIRPAPSALKASLWKHFGFYEVEGEKTLNKGHTICKLCQAKLKYFGNITNMTNHITRFHPEEEEKHSGILVVAAYQRTTEQALSKLPPNFEKSKANYKLYCNFYCQGFAFIFSR